METIPSKHNTCINIKHTNNIEKTLNILDISQIKIREIFCMIYIYFSTDKGKQIKITCERCPTESKKVIDLNGESEICKPNCDGRHEINGILDVNHAIDSKDVPSVGDRGSLSYHMDKRRARLKYYIKNDYANRRIVGLEMKEHIRCKYKCPKLDSYRELEFYVVPSIGNSIIIGREETDYSINY